MKYGKIEEWMIIKDCSELKIGDRVRCTGKIRKGLATVTQGRESNDEGDFFGLVWDEKSAPRPFDNWSNPDLHSTKDCGIIRACKKVKDTKISRAFYKDKIKSEKDGYLIVESV